MLSPLSDHGGLIMFMTLMVFQTVLGYPIPKNIVKNWTFMFNKKKKNKKGEYLGG